MYISIFSFISLREAQVYFGVYRSSSLCFRIFSQASLAILDPSAEISGCKTIKEATCKQISAERPSPGDEQ